MRLDKKTRHSLYESIVPQIDRYIRLFLYCIGLCLDILVVLESGSLKEFKILLQGPEYLMILIFQITMYFVTLTFLL